jgi:AcrR family transcriptional regulator
LVNIKATAEADRSETRRQQILEAASECFRRYGFHGASMATISKAAGMSVGHIYHYFENKEAIIGAIVERDVQDVMTLFEDINRSDDILDAMTGRADHGFDCHVDTELAALALEIAAEAARNPKVAAIVQEADRVKRRVIMELLSKGLAARGKILTSEELEARLEVVASLFEGLSIRTIRNPGLNREKTLSTLRRVLQFTFES